jgi:hypothetical protein
MQIYSSTLKGPLKINGFIDPDDTTIILTFWGCPTWNPNSVYRLGDIVRPSIDNGYYYQCSTNGRTDETEPSWNQDDTTSGTAIFTAIPWDLFVLPDQSILDSVWSTSNNEIITSNEDYSNIYTSITIESIPSSLAEFDLTNQVTKDTGEQLSRTFKYKLNQQ